MALEATIRARCDIELKNSAEAIFKQLGISTSQAINMFLAKVKSENGIPFELKIPNEKTAQVMNEVLNGINMEETSIEQLKAEFESQKHAKH
ncbi:MAG: type II toxin-antitoxin system RelB/DinJ family antitoxin [Sulfurospirillaceae bacterium]|nr:type II toxin-antitoxin system RelB/DinJ family antitoxin [Sulfurospirillaceae bacterium]